MIELSLLFINQPKEMVKLITSKGNGYNYYGYSEERAEPVEVIKVRGRYYLAKYIMGTWLQPVGAPLKNFTLIE